MEPPVTARHLTPTLLLLPVGALILAGCAQGSAQSPQEQQNPDAIEVVATTNVYRDIAQRIGADRVQATEIISSPAQDPHSYEPTARDKLTISKAEVVLANGGGYDAFMDQLISSMPSEQVAQQIHAVDTSPEAVEASAEAGHDEQGEHKHEHGGHEGHQHAGYNEHVWFDLDSMQALGERLASEFGKLDPQHAEQFQANAEQFSTELQELKDRAAAAGLHGKSFAMTEPVPFYLLKDAGMHDATPQGLSEAVEAGGDIPPQTLKKMNDALADGQIDLLAYNIQTEGHDSVAIRSTAEAHSVPVVDFAETMGPDEDYVGWMGAQVDDLAAAAGQ